MRLLILGTAFAFIVGSRTLTAVAAQPEESKKSPQRKESIGAARAKDAVVPSEKKEPLKKARAQPKEAKREDGAEALKKRVERMERLERRAREERLASDKYWEMRDGVTRQRRVMTTEESMQDLEHHERVRKLEEEGLEHLIDPRDRKAKEERGRRNVEAVGRSLGL